MRLPFLQSLLGSSKNAGKILARGETPELPDPASVIDYRKPPPINDLEAEAYKYLLEHGVTYDLRRCLGELFRRCLGGYAKVGPRDLRGAEVINHLMAGMNKEYADILHRIFIAEQWTPEDIRRYRTNPGIPHDPELKIALSRASRNYNSGLMMVGRQVGFLRRSAHIVLVNTDYQVFDEAAIFGVFSVLVAQILERPWIRPHELYLHFASESEGALNDKPPIYERTLERLDFYRPSDGTAICLFDHKKTPEMFMEQLREMLKKRRLSDTEDLTEPDEKPTDEDVFEDITFKR